MARGRFSPRQRRKDSAHEEQLAVLRFQGEEDCAGKLCNPRELEWSGRLASEIWLVETSMDEENWREVAHEVDNEQLNGSWFAGIFPVAGGGECRFVRLVNIGRTHCGDDCLLIHHSFLIRHVRD
jgi:hypothetical protein